MENKPSFHAFRDPIARFLQRHFRGDRRFVQQRGIVLFRIFPE